MNSFNIISTHVNGESETPPQSPTICRSSSHSASHDPDAHRLGLPLQHSAGSSSRDYDTIPSTERQLHQSGITETFDEKSPLLRHGNTVTAAVPRNRLWLLAKRLIDALTESLAWFLSTIKTPGAYLKRCFEDERGQFSPFVPALKVSRAFRRKSKSKNKNKNSKAQAAAALLAGGGGGLDEKEVLRKRSKKMDSSRPLSHTRPVTASAASTLDSDRQLTLDDDAPVHNTRSKTQSPADDNDACPSSRKIRISVHNEATTKRKKQRSRTSNSKRGDGPTDLSEIAAATLKSPTTPASLRLTKYPHAPAPPRPLIPRRQPFYSSPSQQKTLVIDLDETLIHSLAKGGRMSSGHMVEVKLNTPVGLGGGAILGPQHPILYYVHKRPHCDQFLRKICKWYNLVVFTASVQEYADPVIDWLEQEKKYFTARYYRQHCTYRNGAYIKDLSSIQPDLSKVMILDNSPMSYIFHEDNAIPIEGWINDPTDNDLLHLLPMLEALQYVVDVRALLALRRGEAEA